MFDQMKNLKQLAGLLGNQGEIRQRIERMQAELATKTVSADAGAGAVRVTANGKMEITRVELDPVMLRALAGEGGDQDRAMIEELIVGATNEALRRAQALVKEEMTKAATGLNLPGLEGLMGGS